MVINRTVQMTKIWFWSASWKFLGKPQTKSFFIPTEIHASEVLILLNFESCLLPSSAWMAWDVSHTYCMSLSLPQLVQACTKTFSLLQGRKHACVCGRMTHFLITNMSVNKRLLKTEIAKNMDMRWSFVVALCYCLLHRPVLTIFHLMRCNCLR